MIRVSVQPTLLQWAIERSERSVEELTRKQGLQHLPDWLAGTGKPTFKQLQALAEGTWTPIGYFFLPRPPAEEASPIPDFRTVGSRPVGPVSPHLRDMIYLCQRRQVWYREYAQANDLDALPFVGSARTSHSIQAVAAQIRDALDFDLAARAQMKTWEEARLALIRQVEELGVLIMVSGIVGTNTSRTLNPQEFRGFVLIDSLAPLIFVNGRDSKSAQMFTIAHELAHVWLGEAGLSDLQAADVPVNPIESWCNRVAAEVLVPLEAMREAVHPGEALDRALDRLTRQFKVSSLVILRRLLDVHFIERIAFEVAWQEEVARLARFRDQDTDKSTGGDFYVTLTRRVGDRFARALIASTEGGQTLYREAFGLLGISRTDTLRTFGQRLGMVGP